MIAMQAAIDGIQGRILRRIGRIGIVAHSAAMVLASQLRDGNSATPPMP